MKFLFWILFICVVLVAGVSIEAGSANSSIDTLQSIFYLDEDKRKIVEWQGEPPLRGQSIDLVQEKSMEMGRDVFMLEGGTLKIYRNGQIIWETPPDWRIESFELADATRDGSVDLTMSVWKKGSFGTGRPFWVEENDEYIRNHFFIHHLSDDRFLPRWQSSALDTPKCEYAFADITGDGWDELITIEGFYFLEGCGRGRFVSVWFWNGWSFVLLGRSRPGSFSNLHIRENNNTRFILVDDRPTPLF